MIFLIYQTQIRTYQEIIDNDKEFYDVLTNKTTSSNKDGSIEEKPLPNDTLKILSEAHDRRHNQLLFNGIFSMLQIIALILGLILFFNS